jgi:hypothetical protein
MLVCGLLGTIFLFVVLVMIAYDLGRSRVFKIAQIKVHLGK